MTPPTSSTSQPPSPPSPPPQPDVFQHYQVLRRPDGTLWELGRGAMGITYKAFDVNLRCHVALKVVNAQYLHSETAKARFVREARAAARLRHPNVASVYHLGMDAESFFYAMEFIDGETLESLVRRLGPLAPATALRLMLQVARALIASSRQRLVHRDIKPANLMVVRDEDEEGDEHAQLRVKVIDFGLARSLFSTSATGVPPSSGGHGALSNVTLGGFVGTPLFASPEQLEEKDLDARSDFYSLGVTLWYLLAGQPPFTGTLASIISQHLTREPPLENLPTTVPECVRTLLTRLLEKDPAKRPQTGSELRADLEGCLRAVLAARAAKDGDAEMETVAEPDALFTVEAADLPVSGRRSDGAAGFSTGTILGNRFRIIRFVGEGGGGRVFLARDFQAKDAPVAVRVLPSDLIATPQEEENFRADYERSKQAPHPALLASHAFERHGTHYYLAQEWVSGFTLVDLLRNRGTLAMEDALRVLHSAALATDHAAANGVSHRLDFAPHQVLVHFPGDRVNDGSDAPLRPVPLGPLSGWPEWQLKLNPLGVGRDASDIVTWAGEMTLLPETEKLPTRDTHSSIAGWTPETGRLLPALGRLVYEMLGGGVTPGAGPVRFVNRPALSEEANAVLGRCVNGDDAGFTSGLEFYETLARAAGFDPDTLRPFISAPPPLAMPSTALIPTAEVAPEITEGAAAAAGADPANATREGAPPPGAAPTVVETRRIPFPVVPVAKNPPRTRTPARKLSDSSLARPDRSEPDRFPPLSVRGAATSPATRGLAADSDISSDSARAGQSLSSATSADEWRDMLLGEPAARSRLLQFAVVAAVLLFCAAGVFALRQIRRPAPVAATAPPAAAARPPSATVAATPVAPPPANTAARPKTSPAVVAAAPPPAATPRSTPASPSPRVSATERVAAVSSSSPARAASATPAPAPSVSLPPAAANPRSLAEEIAANPTSTPSRLPAVPPPPPVIAPDVVAADAPPAGKSAATVASSAPTPARPVEVAPIAPPPVPAPEAVNVPAPTPAPVAATTAALSKGTATTTVVVPPPASSAPSARSAKAPAPAHITKTAPSSSRPPEPSAAAAESSDAGSTPPSAPASEKRVAVHLTSDPSKAEITLRGESLGVTPKTVMLPPGEHELVAHYWNWPEVRQQIYLSPEDKTADVKVRLISPDQIPINRSAGAAELPPAKGKEGKKEKLRDRDKKRANAGDTANAPVAIPVAPDEQTPTPAPRRRGPFGIFGRAKAREPQPPPAAVPVLPAQPVPPPARPSDGQPFFDGRIIELPEPPTARTDADRPRG